MPFHKTIQYQALRDFLRSLGVEWTSILFKDHPEQTLMKARRLGRVEIQGWDYTPEDIMSLQEETEGTIDTLSFSQGRNEGYKLFIRTESGQLIDSKFFGQDLCGKIMGWFSRQP